LPLASSRRSSSPSTPAIADRLGTTHSTIQRRLVNDTASAVVDLATAYSVNPIGGLLAAGVITQEQLAEYSRPARLEELDDLELAQAVVDRIAARQESPLSTLTEFPAGGKDQLGNVSVFTPERSKDGASVRSQSDDDGTVRDFDWEPGTYAADGSTDEQEAREARGEDPID
jgi:uncharacterized protein YceH (UPF0502 family)